MTDKLRDYSQLIKLRLSLLVVFSAAMSFLIASVASPDWQRFVFLIAGGFLVTGASNGFNQVIEWQYDKLMDRTRERPLPAARMTTAAGFLVSFITGAAGVFVLSYFINPLCGMLSLLALLLYVLAYTPLKRATPFAVFVGAFPGAIPPLLGWVAATGDIINPGGWILFGIQFIWQFPHFWAIAWVMHDDYLKAGFHLLPHGGRNRASAFQLLVYSAGLIPIGLLPWLFHLSGGISAIIISVCGILFTFQAVKLYRTCSMKAASILMFASFAYLPVVLIAIWADRLPLLH